MENQDYRRKIADVVNYITKNFIAEELSDLLAPGCTGGVILGRKSIDESELRRYVPATITLTLLNSILGNNTLLKGGSGTAKTQLAKVIGTILYQIPVEFFDLKKTTGAPKQTRDNIYGTHDFPRMLNPELGPSEFLYLPYYAPIVIIDEINRWTNLEQNIIREGISSDVWPVDGKSFHIPDQIVIAAMNPESYEGTNLLNENLADNFAIQLPPPEYNSILHDKLVRESKTNIENLLGCRDLVEKLEEYYRKDKGNTKYVIAKIKDISEEMKKVLDERKVPYIYNGDITKIRQEIEAQEFDPETTFLQHMIIAEMTYSYKFGRNRSSDPRSDHTHDQKYLSTKISEPLKGRFLNDWTALAKAISWYVGEEKVSIDALRTAFIYTAAHRIKPEKDFYQKIYSERRVDGMPVGFEPMAAEYECARAMFNSVYDHYNDLKPESDEMFKIRKAIQIMNNEDSGKSDKLEDALNTLEDAYNILKNVDHPVGKLLSSAIADYKIKLLKGEIKLKGEDNAS